MSIDKSFIPSGIDEEIFIRIINFDMELFNLSNNPYYLYDDDCINDYIDEFMTDIVGDKLKKICYQIIGIFIKNNKLQYKSYEAAITEFKSIVKIRIEKLDFNKFNDILKNIYELNMFSCDETCHRCDFYHKDFIKLINQIFYDRHVDIIYKSITEIKKLEKKITDLETHIKYMPGGDGYTEAKLHFESENKN